MGKTKKISWKPFDKMVQETGSRIGQIYGVEHRVLFAEIISAASGSSYVRIPREFALMSPKPTKNIYKVEGAYSIYYTDLQNQLKESPIPLLSNDGEFLVSTTEVFTFIKKLSPVKQQTISQALEDIKMATGVDISDEDDDEKSSSSSTSTTKDKDVEDEVEGGDEGDEGGGPIVKDTIIEFDSDDEIEDFFDSKNQVVPSNKEKKPHKTLEKSKGVEIESFYVGVIYPLLTLKDFFKKARASELEKYAALAKEEVGKFEARITSQMISQIDQKLDSLRERMASKISEFAQKEKVIQKAIKDDQKALRDAQQILRREMAIEPKKFEEKVSEAKDNLRDLHIKLSQVKEDTKGVLRNFLAALEEID